MTELNKESLPAIRQAISILDSARDNSRSVRGSQHIGYYGADDKAYGRGDISVQLPIDQSVSRAATSLVQEALLSQSPRIESSLSFNIGTKESVLSMSPENKLNTSLFERLKGFAISSFETGSGITAEDIIIKDKTRQLTNAVSCALESLKDKLFEIEHGMYNNGNETPEARRLPSPSPSH